MRFLISFFILSTSLFCSSSVPEVESFSSGFIVYSSSESKEITTIMDKDFRVVEQVIIDIDSSNEVFVELIELDLYRVSSGDNEKIVTKKDIDKLYL